MNEQDLLTQLQSALQKNQDLGFLIDALKIQRDAAQNDGANQAAALAKANAVIQQLMQQNKELTSQIQAPTDDQPVLEPDEVIPVTSKKKKDVE